MTDAADRISQQAETLFGVLERCCGGTDSLIQTFRHTGQRHILMRVRRIVPGAKGDIWRLELPVKYCPVCGASYE